MSAENAASPVVAVQGVIHNPLFWRVLRQPDLEPGLADVRDHFERFRADLADARPDVIVFVGSDHLTEIFYDRMPPIMMGKAGRYRGTNAYEARDWDLPFVQVPGAADVARELLPAVMERDVDVTFSEEMVLDHSVIQPLLYMRPEFDIPVVPIMTNCMAPPLPSARRFYQYGQALRSALDETASGMRVAVVVSGHLSVEIGGPMHHLGPSDVSFDEEAVDWIRAGDVEAATRDCDFDRMVRAGNVTHQFLNFILAMGVAGGRPASFAEGVKSRFTTSPFFSWQP